MATGGGVPPNRSRVSGAVSRGIAPSPSGRYRTTNGRIRFQTVATSARQHTLHRAPGPAGETTFEVVYPRCHRRPTASLDARQSHREGRTRTNACFEMAAADAQTQAASHVSSSSCRRGPALRCVSEVGTASALASPIGFRCMTPPNAARAHGVRGVAAACLVRGAAGSSFFGPDLRVSKGSPLGADLWLDKTECIFLLGHDAIRTWSGSGQPFKFDAFLDRKTCLPLKMARAVCHVCVRNTDMSSLPSGVWTAVRTAARFPSM